MSQQNPYFQLIKKNNIGEIENYQEHTDASNYFGCEYTYDKMNFIQRTSKKTPTKIGSFVTLWKRDKNGITCPYTDKDKIDFLIIIIDDTENNRIGHFCFPKELLKTKGVLSSTLNSSVGKRGFRVYSLWDYPSSKQALSTQKWQVDYFREGCGLNTRSLY